MGRGEQCQGSLSAQDIEKKAFEAVRKVKATEGKQRPTE